MVKFVMLVGISGSGKSTYAEENALIGNYKIVSSDTIREELYGDASCQSNPAKVFKIAHNRICEYLEQGENVIFDATNLESKHRKQLLTRIDYIPGVKKVCWIIFPPVEWCISNQDLRERKVPERVIRRQFKKFQMPTADEGWDRIIITDHVTSEQLYPEPETGYYVGMNAVKAEGSK